uniref:AB hydrolase-1 domain-containing protein n=1 Tax=Ananas comosus var. bracteatus TaxID=296719 RepID=A0A6V7QXZ0_ANACO
MAIHVGISSTCSLPHLFPGPGLRREKLGLRCRASLGGEDEYLIDAPESFGDGFSFSGGKYADGPNRSDEWFSQGKMIKAHPVYGNRGKAKEPIFGLTMGSSSQSSADFSNPSVVLIHGFPSQAYSYRKILPILSEGYHATAFDWLDFMLLRFWVSDKPQPKYGFDYTLDEYVSSLESLIDVIAPNKLSLVVQGYFAPVAVKYVSYHQEKLRHLILINPPITEKHAKLPSTLSLFSNFLLGEIFSQDPLRASDKALTSSGPYMMKEEDAMVYRRPYLTSGSSGFALNAISRAMKKDLKAYVEAMKVTLAMNPGKSRQLYVGE